MAHVLSIVHGSTTIALVSGNYVLQDYVPVDGSGKTVEEPVRLLFTGSAVTDINASIENIRRAFELAERRYDTGRGDRVWINFQPSGFADTYRAEITRPAPGKPAGYIDLPPGTLGKKWVAKNIEGGIRWVRKNWWEDNSETELSLANGGDSGTGGINIYNFHATAEAFLGTVGFSLTSSKWRISDADNGLAIFRVGDVISLRGDQVNDGVYTINTVDGGGAYIEVNEWFKYTETNGTRLENFVTNGTFDDDSSWDKGVGWTIASDVAHCDGTQAGNSDLDQNSILIDAVDFEIVFTVSNYSAGTITPYCGSGTAGTARSANGTYTETLTCATSTDLILRGNVDFVGDIDNVTASPVITIFDYLDYVDIDSAVLDGDLPAGCRVVIDNTDAAAALETVWIGHNVIGNPQSVPHILEIADSDTGTDVADVNGSSSEVYRTYAIGATEAKVTGWTIPHETLALMDSGYFRVLLFSPDGTNLPETRWRIKMIYSGTTIWETPLVGNNDTYNTIARCIREIETVQLPPFWTEDSNANDLDVDLYCVRTGEAINVKIDCLILLPVEGFRRLRSLDGIAQNSVLNDDSIAGTVYQEISSSQVRDIVAVGKQIMLYPNADNRLYFLLHSVTANTAAHDRVANVTVYYRPRRRTI